MLGKDLAHLTLSYIRHAEISPVLLTLFTSDVSTSLQNSLIPCISWEDVRFHVKKHFPSLVNQRCVNHARNEVPLVFVRGLHLNYNVDYFLYTSGYRDPTQRLEHAKFAKAVFKDCLKITEGNIKRSVKMFSRLCVFACFLKNSNPQLLMFESRPKPYF